MSPTTESATKTTTCSPCAAGAHLLCRRKSDGRECGCATCFPAPSAENTIKGLFVDMAFSLWRYRGLTDEAAVRDQVQTAVRHQLAHETIDQWMLSPVIAEVIMGEQGREYWSLDEFTERITATGINAEILNSPYVVV